MSEKEQLLAVNATPVGDDPAATTTTTGAWKSGLFGCFKHGICHKALCCAWCCPTLFMGQLLERAKLTWIGTPSSSAEEYKKTFKTVLALAICVSLIVSIFSCPAELPVGDVDGKISMVPNPDCASWRNDVSNLASGLFGLYALVAMIRLRGAIRAKSGIPEGNCGQCDDCCVVWWCGCCSAVQIAHQTADYDGVDEARCFSTTGLDPAPDAAAGTAARGEVVVEPLAKAIVV